MAIPLPRVVADVMPGGNIITGMRGANALTAENLQNDINAIKAQYAPLSIQSEAASKLAYANLMGPQFLAKLMGNQDILANMTPTQRDAALAKVYQAGSGQGTGNNIFGNSPYMNLNQRRPNSLMDYLVNKLVNVFEKPQVAETAQQNPVNRLLQSPNLSREDQQNIKSMQPGGSYVVQGNQGNANLSQPNKFAENVGTYSGIKEEGKEAGKIRANDIKELNDIVFNADTNLATLEDINDMLASPEIRQIRQLPLAGRHELAYYAKEGTPAQQQLVGRLLSQFGNIIKDSSRDFAGQFRKGEQELLQGMKPNDSDTIDTMIGKAESLTVMRKLLRDRAALTAKYIRDYHIDKGKAKELADKEIDGNVIRKNIHDKLNPTVTLRNPKTGEQITIPITEAREGGFRGG